MKGSTHSYGYLPRHGYTLARTGGLWRITCAVADARGNDVYTVGTEREWVEIRVTRTVGLLRVGKPVRGKHPYFSPDEDDAE